jgi:hypothetical protein
MYNVELRNLTFQFCRNYVLQLVFELRLPWATVDILDRLEGNYADLSMQKFSSHVVEKCLKYADDEHRTRLIQELIENPRLDQIHCFKLSFVLMKNSRLSILCSTYIHTHLLFRCCPIFYLEFKFGFHFYYYLSCEPMFSKV